MGNGANTKVVAADFCRLNPSILGLAAAKLFPSLRKNRPFVRQRIRYFSILLTEKPCLPRIQTRAPFLLQRARQISARNMRKQLPPL
jgi:hypothetical protein